MPFPKAKFLFSIALPPSDECDPHFTRQFQRFSFVSLSLSLSFYWFLPSFFLMLLSSSFNTEDLDWKVISSRVEVFGMWKEREKKQKTIDSFFLYLFIFLLFFFWWRWGNKSSPSSAGLSPRDFVFFVSFLFLLKKKRIFPFIFYFIFKIFFFWSVGGA